MAGRMTEKEEVEVYAKCKPEHLCGVALHSVIQRLRKILRANESNPAETPYVARVANLIASYQTELDGICSRFGLNFDPISQDHQDAILNAIAGDHAEVYDTSS